ncbi:hypothetical protein [Mucilaginibacter terrae]|nr:hypothetical protein [Mucilaginibacter terrae]
MAAIFFTISTTLKVMVIPDTQAHSNGHQIITYTYSVYKDQGDDYTTLEDSKLSELHLTKHHDPNYMGYITFEDPGRLFTYTADGELKLNADQVEEIIEHISHYRDNPGLWRHIHQ